jgi:hypothetical protein
MLDGYRWVGRHLSNPSDAKPTIGHRDTKSTECPGSSMYAALPKIQPPFTSAIEEDDDMAWTQQDWQRMSNLVDARIAEATDDIAAAVFNKLVADGYDDEAQGSVIRVETLRLVRRGVNEALGAEQGDDDPGKLAAEFATVNAKLDALTDPPAG